MESMKGLVSAGHFWNVTRGFLTASVIANFIQGCGLYLMNQQISEMRIEREEKKKEQIADRQPKLMIFTDKDSVPIDDFGDLEKKVKFRVRNLGRGIGHDAEVSVTYHALVEHLDGGEIRTRDVPMESLPARLFATIPPDEGRDISIFPYTWDKNFKSQSLLGNIMIECRNDQNQDVFFMQRIKIIFDMKNMVAHVILGAHEEIKPEVIDGVPVLRSRIK